MELTAPGCEHARVKQRPRLLSGNGLSYIAEGRADYLNTNGMGRVRGAPLHPQTQSNIEREIEAFVVQRAWLVGTATLQVGTDLNLRCGGLCERS